LIALMDPLFLFPSYDRGRKMTATERGEEGKKCFDACNHSNAANTLPPFRCISRRVLP